MLTNISMVLTWILKGNLWGTFTEGKSRLRGFCFSSMKRCRIYSEGRWGVAARCGQDQCKFSKSGNNGNSDFYCNGGVQACGGLWLAGLWITFFLRKRIKQMTSLALNKWLEVVFQPTLILNQLLWKNLQLRLFFPHREVSGSKFFLTVSGKPSWLSP